MTGRSMAGRSTSETGGEAGFQVASPRVQASLASEPYDRWLSPAGECMAEFNRREAGFLVRFPGQVDFALDRVAGSSPAAFAVTAWPVAGCPARTVRSLYTNAIVPIVGNHSGGLFLHGSAVAVDGLRGAIAFLGLSRSGKTTLAGAFARSGHPFLTEDVIDIDRRGEDYWIRPKPSPLRLFADSAAHLMGFDATFDMQDGKQEVADEAALPFASDPVPLRRIFVLGADHAAKLAIRRYSAPEALAVMLEHAFILDVEDAARLREHFLRIADLGQAVPCHSLDYPRDYNELPAVIDAILALSDAA